MKQSLLPSEILNGAVDRREKAAAEASKCLGESGKKQRINPDTVSASLKKGLPAFRKSVRTFATFLSDPIQHAFELTDVQGIGPANKKALTDGGYPDAITMVSEFAALFHQRGLPAAVRALHCRLLGAKVGTAQLLRLISCVAGLAFVLDVFFSPVKPDLHLVLAAADDKPPAWWHWSNTIRSVAERILVTGLRAVFTATGGDTDLIPTERQVKEGEKARVAFAGKSWSLSTLCKNMPRTVWGEIFDRDQTFFFTSSMKRKVADLSTRAALCAKEFNDHPHLSKMVFMDGHGRFTAKLLRALNDEERISLTVVDIDKWSQRWHELFFPLGVKTEQRSVLATDAKALPDEKTFVYLNFCGATQQQKAMYAFFHALAGKGLGSTGYRLLLSFSYVRAAAVRHNGRLTILENIKGPEYVGWLRDEYKTARMPFVATLAAQSNRKRDDTGFLTFFLQFRN